MTIGPEPSSRMRARSVLLGIEDVSQDIVERAARAPARRRAQLGGIADQIGSRLASHLARIHFVFRSDAEQLLQSCMNFFERDGAAGGDVVYLARQTSLEEQRIGVGDVVH